MKTDKKLHTFKLRVIGGEEQEFTSRHSAYAIAVLDAFGRLDLSYPCDVEIWSPGMPEEGYGPYRYRIDDFVDMRGNQYVCPSVMALRPLPRQEDNR